MNKLKEVKMSQEQSEEELELYAAKLNSLSLRLASIRAEAINGRRAQGIETEWGEDEDHYEGYDYANRSDAAAWRSKPVGRASLPNDKKNTGSRVFPNITRPYVDAASARCADLLLPTNDKPWELSATPIAEWKDIAEGKIPEKVRGQINEAFPDDPEGVEKTTNEIVEKANEEVSNARQKIEKATKRIEDWHVECQYLAEVRKVIEDCAKIGSGVLKGPVIESRRQVAFVDGALVINNEIKPASMRVSAWNFFPDPGCGNNIHNGSYCWERDDISEKKLIELRGYPGYIEHQIEAVLREGPAQATGERPEVNNITGLSARDTKNLYEIWYYYGRLKKEDLETLDCECEDETLSMPVQITMINNKIVRAIINPLDTGEFPYDVMVWQRRQNMPWGIGVARQMRTPQQIVTNATRAMMDNAGRASGPQVIIKEGIVSRHDGIAKIEPWGIWFAAEDSELDHLDNAFRFVKVDMYQQELQAIIEYGMRLAEDTTGLPLIMQGQIGTQTAETYKGMQLQNDNASTVLRRLARLFDDLITEPHLRRYYSYLLQYGEDDEKGDFQIHARGSSALVQRDMESQEIIQLLNMSLNPVYGLDPKKCVTEYLKSRRLPTQRFEYNDEEFKAKIDQILQGMQQPDASVEAANVRAQAQIEVAKIRAQAENAETQSKEEIANSRMAFEQEQKERDRELKILLDRMKGELDSLSTEKKDKMNLDKIKADLSKLVMTLNTQVSLSGKEGGQVAKPVVEPPGRAKPGRGFEQ